ncbi:homocitrate synthase [Mycolicibacterium moriokaense]|nr:homocitrate synthase [Mycolicibacterium moriokaense]
MTSPPQSTTGAAPSPSAADRFIAPLPRDLRTEADAMDWHMFTTTYAPAAGPLRLGQWTCTDGECPATRLGPQARNFQATLALGDRISVASAAASGPIAALTEMLYDLGIAVEMTAFHQLSADGETATFICGSDGAHTEWAMGVDEDATQSALRAMIACANRLLSAEGGG